MFWYQWILDEAKEAKTQIGEVKTRLTQQTWGTTAVISPFRGSCYNCGKPGHMAKDCWAKKNNLPQACMGYANVIMDKEEDMHGVQPPLQGDHTNQLAQMIASMSMDELNQMMNQVPVGENQDFVGA